mmetsp:Transcript_41873/g.75449  ORF Transcript_41873/g.75449 Transcript_41873/m.75449 type:complete len:233 (+) Transcript_41873:873-1571(+)
MNRLRKHRRTRRNGIIPRLQPWTNHNKMLQRTRNRRTQPRHNVRHAHVRLHDLLLVLGLALLGRHAQQRLPVHLIARVGCELFEVRAAGGTGQIAVSLEAFADGAGRGKGEGVFGRCIALVGGGVWEEMKLSIEVVIESFGHRLDYGRVILGKYAQVIGSLVPACVHVIRDVNFHMNCRSGIGGVAQFSTCHYGAVHRLGIMLGGCLDEGLADCCFIVVSLQILHQIRTRGQ